MDRKRVNRFSMMVCVVLFNPWIMPQATELSVENLEGITDVALVISVNGQQYFRGSKSLRSRETVEYNLEKVQSQLEKENLPVDIQSVKGFYSSLLKILRPSHLRVNRFYRGELTVVPRLMAAIRVKPAPTEIPDYYLVSIHLTLSRLVWIRQGPEKNSQVQIWSDYEMAVVNRSSLVTEIVNISDRLLSRFLSGHREANQ